MRMNRPTVLNIVIILLILAGLLNWIANFLPDSNYDSTPPVVGYGILVLGVLALVAAFGLFKHKGWSMLLAIIVSILDACLWIGGIPSDSALIKGYSILLVALNALIVVLLLLPSVLRSSATERVREVS
jgi:peptidoglycan/LPS O-acetylase OafA/YrhL